MERSQNHDCRALLDKEKQIIVQTITKFFYKFTLLLPSDIASPVEFYFFLKTLKRRKIPAIFQEQFAKQEVCRLVSQTTKRRDSFEMTSKGKNILIYAMQLR